MVNILSGIDVWLMYFFNVTVHNPVFDRFMPIFHNGGAWIVPAALIWLSVMIFGGAKGRWAGLGAIVVIILTDQVSSAILKPLVARVRPCNVLGGIWLWKNGAWMVTPEPVIEIYKSSFSFTSSHAANSGGQVFWWSMLYPRMKWVLISLGVAIGYSRIYDGVHYPIDVLTGWAVGAVCFVAVWYAINKWGSASMKKSLGFNTRRDGQMTSSLPPAEAK